MGLRTLIALACLMLTDALRTTPRARPPVMMAKKVAKLVDTGAENWSDITDLLHRLP